MVGSSIVCPGADPASVYIVKSRSLYLQEKTTIPPKNLYKGYKGYKKKGLQSRSATASLLIKNYQCMQEEL